MFLALVALIWRGNVCSCFLLLLFLNGKRNLNFGSIALCTSSSFWSCKLVGWCLDISAWIFTFLLSFCCPSPHKWFLYVSWSLTRIESAVTDEPAKEDHVHSHDHDNDHEHHDHDHHHHHHDDSHDHKHGTYLVFGLGSVLSYLLLNPMLSKI